MNICMAGIDWETAKIDERQRFGLTPAQAAGLAVRLRDREGVCGCVILATCNRTEIYLTWDAGHSPEPIRLFCREMGISYEDAKRYFKTRMGHEAVRHLFEVSCGLKSQILGEDQILPQVRSALELAHKARVSNGMLQTLFRIAVTAGKEVKSKVRLTNIPLSAASWAVEEIRGFYGGALAGKRAVVIGNGEMGRLASGLLVEAGCDVTVTLRSYRHGETVVPRGCKTVPYDDRMAVIDGSDILISATTSPHYTVTRAQVEALRRRPGFVADISLPRDIEPAVKHLPKTMFLDMDCMVGDRGHNAKAREKIESIIEKYIADYNQWWAYKEAIPHMDELKTLALQRALGTREFAALLEPLGAEEQGLIAEAAALAAHKTVELLLGGMKAAVTPELLKECGEKMQNGMSRKAKVKIAALRIG